MADINWWQFGGEALQDLGTGIAQGGFKNGFGLAAQETARLQPYRQQQVEKQQAVKQEKDRTKAAADAIISFGGDKRYADAVLSGAMDPSTAWNAVLTKQAYVDPTDTVEGRQALAAQYNLPPEQAQAFVLTGNLPGGNQSARAGVGQPVTMRNRKTNELRAVQPMTMGPGQDLLTGQPFENTEEWVYDPVGVAADKTSATVDAKTSAAARAALPSAEQSAKMASQTIDALLTDEKGMSEQFGNTLGIPNQKMPAWPGTPMARFRSLLEQGQGQAFMQARIALKGGGQITDYEGARAEAAYSRMTLAAQNNNQSEFQHAAQEFQQAITDGLEKLRATANDGYAAGSSAVTGGGAADPLGIR